MKIRVISVVLAIASLPGWAQSIVYNQSPSRAFGQLSMNLSSTAPNLVEGKELFSPQSVALDTTVSDVAHRCGFASASSFIAAFRDETGTTPAAWRRATT